MRRFPLAVLLFAATTGAACSLLNAPGDVNPGGGGAGGSPTTSSVTTSTDATTTTTATTTSTGTSSSTSSGTGGGCASSTECASLSDACNVGVCTAGACTKMVDPAKEGLACDDGLFCTVNDVCTAGACAGVTKTCPDTSGTSSSSGAGGGSASSSGAGGGVPMPDACHVWACVEAAQQCMIVVGNTGSACDDGEPCTTGETCAPNGFCGNSVPTNCSALNSECSVGKCVLGVGCAPDPQLEGFACDVLNPCATSKCTAGKCNIVVAKNTGLSCDDGLYCTKTDTCQGNGTCSGPPTCTNPTPCIVSTCDETANKCVLDPKASGEPCATSACSAGQTCDNNGTCGGGTAAETYFYENFANNNKGWLLGPEWQIGSAQVSVGGAIGADPGQDNSPTGDNGVAGVVIGGNENPNTLHPQYYLESPLIDISAAQGQLYLTYYRWLNSDYLPFMKNVVEVYDGTKWVEIWASGPPPSIQDSPPAGAGWTFVSHDITPYKNAAIKVRFGYDIESGGVYTIGSWNLDDVKLQNTVCPTVP